MEEIAILLDNKWLEGKHKENTDALYPIHITAHHFPRIHGGDSGGKLLHGHPAETFVDKNKNTHSQRILYSR